MTQNRSYESFLTEAKIKSRGCYAYVVTIVNYRTGQDRMAVMVSKSPLKDKAIGCEFVGVNAGFFNGESCFHKESTASPVATVNRNVDELPF